MVFDVEVGIILDRLNDVIAFTIGVVVAAEGGVVLCEAHDSFAVLGARNELECQGHKAIVHGVQHHEGSWAFCICLQGS